MSRCHPALYILAAVIIAAAIIATIAITFFGVGL